MADPGGQQRELVFCHGCKEEWLREQHGLECPTCHSDFVEIIDERHDPRDNHITINNDDGPGPAANFTTQNNDSLPRHPLHHHNPWRDHAPDPDGPSIEHVEWNPAPGVHVSYRTTTHGSGPRGQPDPFGPMFQTFSTMFESAFNGPGRAPRSPRIQQTDPMNRQRPGSPFPFSDGPQQRHSPWTLHGPQGGRGVYTATGRWPPSGGPGPFPGLRDGNDVNAVLGTFLQSMQTGIMEQGHGAPNGMAAFLSMLRGGAHGDAVYTDEALDRIITQMMEQQNAGGAPGPASAAAIAALPKQKVEKSMMGDNGKAECSVCMDSVNVGDEVTMLPCKHWFHEECVGVWLKEHDTCPHCRQGIMPKDAPETSDTPRSPEQEPRHSQYPFLFHTPQTPLPSSSQPQRPSGSSNQPPPPTMPGAFTQSGMQQPYMPGGYQQYPEPRTFVTPQPPFPHSRTPPPIPSQQGYPSVHHRRRSSARERSNGTGGGGGGSNRSSNSSSGGRSGVAGWFRSLGGGHGNSDR
ncbi:hypothetical protein ACLMJK_001823 [Lecanora helva]